MTLLNVSIKLGFAVPVPMKIGSKLATFVFMQIHNEDISFTKEVIFFRYKNGKIYITLILRQTIVRESYTILFLCFKPPFLQTRIFDEVTLLDLKNSDFHVKKNMYSSS